MSFDNSYGGGVDDLNEDSKMVITLVKLNEIGVLSQVEQA
jgi:hypothetical protein